MEITATADDRTTDYEHGFLAMRESITTDAEKAGVDHHAWVTPGEASMAYAAGAWTISEAYSAGPVVLVVHDDRPEQEGLVSADTWADLEGKIRKMVGL